MSTDYFSDRERGQAPRTVEDIPQTVWAALVHQIQARIGDGSFGHKFPDFCPDGGAAVSGSDPEGIKTMMLAEIPGLNDHYPLQASNMPELYDILDLLEFTAQSIAKPSSYHWHSYFRHDHLNFDRDAGLAEYVADVNRLFARNAIAFELTDAGKVARIAPPMLREIVVMTTFRTGDAEADRLLERARREIMSAKIDDRFDALEKLWDAFERIKTLEDADKKTGVKAILDKAAQGPKLRQFLENEATELTHVGNEMQIRHFETTKEKIEQAAHVDYLFHRIFSFITLLLRMSGRIG